MQSNRHGVFISYHHEKDQVYKDYLIRMGESSYIFVDRSVSEDDISDDLDDQAIRKIIRDKNLRDSSVTVLLCGEETRNRKHIDWELYSSMHDGEVNKKSGIVVIVLPSVENNYFTAPHENEKVSIYPDNKNWMAVKTRKEYMRRYPYLPERIIDNLLKPEAKLSVCPWSRIQNRPNLLQLLIENAFNSRKSNQYDLGRPMRRHNKNPPMQA